MAHQHHHHGHQQEHDWGARAEELEFEGALALRWATGALDWVAERIPEPGSILDLGAGPGVFSIALAERFPAATVTAVDSAPELTDRARKRAAKFGLADRIGTETADLATDLAPLPDADLVWASKVMHHVPDHTATLTAIRGKLRPGGVVALVEGGLGLRWLPAEFGIGEPGLMSRLDGLISAVIAAEGSPRAHNWDVLLAEAGLGDARSRTFLLDIPAPVDTDIREWAARRIAHAAEWVGGDLSAADQEALRRLTDPAEPLGVHQRPDLFVLGASTVHVAQFLG